MEPTAAPVQEVHIPGKLVIIEVYVALTATFLGVLVCFGSFRRRSRSSLFKKIVWIGYILCTDLITYAMGQMQSAPFHNELFAIWASFSLIVLGSADSISAYKVEDNEQKTRYDWRITVQSFWLGWLMAEYAHREKFKILLSLLYLVIVLKIDERGRTYKWSSRSALARNTKGIMDFMDYCENKLSNIQDETDAAQMKGCNYVVIGEKQITVTANPPLYQKEYEIKDEVINIQKILQCKGKLLTATSDPDDLLKDICLSFALHKIICRRLAGYTLLERPRENAWSFVREWLLFKKDDYERSFRVIEVELAFLFDLLYTKYPVIFEPGRLKRKIFELITIVVGFFVAISLLNNYQTPEGQVNVKVHGHNIDVVLTAIVILAIVLLEIVQIVFLIFSDWAKVILLCKYVQKPSWQASKYFETMIEFVCGTQLFQPWARKIGQYSLLRSFDHNPSRWKYNFITSEFLDRPGSGRKESPPAKLPAEVKKAIIHSLRKYNNDRRVLTNVEASLQNGVLNELSWGCKLETTTHVIMVWHVATSFCEESSPASVQHSQSENFIVATSLSKYCAYLVAFAPRFLPDNAYDSESIFDQIVKETRELFNGCQSMEEKKRKMISVADEDAGNSVIRNGAVLGNRLRGLGNEELLWKILAEFWVEMMLFVAPSDDATVHAEYLAQGGEFVTHLWALLSHVGILKRESVVPEI